MTARNNEDIETRLALLEFSMKHIQTDFGDMRTDSTHSHEKLDSIDTRLSEMTRLQGDILKLIGKKSDWAGWISANQRVILALLALIGFLAGGMPVLEAFAPALQQKADPVQPEVSE